MEILTNEILTLAGTAVSIGFIHTILGPDHYVPFVAMAKAREWNLAKTALVTSVCGLGHVLGSIVLGLIGAYLGILVLKIEWIESWRGDLAAWLLITFGFFYLLWGVHHALNKWTHGHLSHHAKSKTDQLTPWVLFVIFLLGPCEPLIPLLMYPAAKFNMFAVFIVALAFGVTTILTMLASVIISYLGLRELKLSFLERFTHVIAGLSILLCGGAIKFLGL